MTDTPVPCADKLLALHAFADGELDAHIKRHCGVIAIAAQDLDY